MPNVPTTNLNALYANTAPGNVIQSAVIDPAMQDLAQTINDNFALFQELKFALELPIPDQSIVTRHLRNLAVTNPKLAPLAVTADKIADGSITLAKLADLVVTAAKIANGTITEPKYAPGSVSSRAIGTGEVKATNLDPALYTQYGDIALNARFGQIDEKLEDIVTLINPTMTSQEIQNLLNNSGTFRFTKGDQVYLLDFLIGPAQPVCLDVQSNTKIEIEKGAVITIPPTSEGRYYIFQIDKKDNVTIVGGEIVGDKLVHTGSTGEQGYGIGIRGSTNVTIDGTTIKTCWGDGIVIGRSYDNTVSYSDTVRLTNITCDNNRRQGISLTSCRNFWLVNSTLKNTNGTAPQAGIDLEPDQAFEALENINIINLKTENNAGAGILVAPFKLGEGATKSQFNTTINIHNHKSTGDFRGMYLVGSNAATNKIDGEINISNSYVSKPTEAGIRFENWYSSVFPHSIVQNSVIKNPNGLNTNLGNTGRSGFVIYARNTYREGEYGNVDFINCSTTDDRIVGVDFTTVKGFWFEGELPTQKIKANVINPKADVFLSPGFVRWNIGEGVVKFDNKPIVSTASGVSIRDASGCLITSTSSGSFTLPPVNECIGREYSFIVTNNQTFNITPTTGDSILGFDYFTNKTVTISKNGDLLTIRSIGNNLWLVVEKQGFAHPSSASRQPRTYYQTSPPSTLASVVGDTVINTTPTRTKNINSWMNVTAGSSGSWQAYGTGYGTTAERPALTAYDACYCYFDTSLAKMILWNGSSWLI